MDSPGIPFPRCHLQARSLRSGPIISDIVWRPAPTTSLGDYSTHMLKAVHVGFFAAVVVLSCRAQLSPLPPASLSDGIHLHSGTNGPDLAHWRASALWNYRLGEDSSFEPPLPGGIDGHGRRWVNQAPATTNLNLQGGTVRLAFLGSTPQWSGAVGYTYSGDLADSRTFTLAANSGALVFADQANISLGAGSASHFDFWLNSVTGTYRLFAQASGGPSAASDAILWLETPLLVPTYLPAYGAAHDTPTWVASIAKGENAYRLAVQFFYPEGGNFDPLHANAVPEPAAYGIGAALALLACALKRCRTDRR